MATSAPCTLGRCSSERASGLPARATASGARGGRQDPRQHHVAHRQHLLHAAGRGGGAGRVPLPGPAQVGERDGAGGAAEVERGLPVVDGGDQRGRTGRRPRAAGPGSSGAGRPGAGSVAGLELVGVDRGQIPDQHLSAARRGRRQPLAPGGEGGGELLGREREQRPAPALAPVHRRRSASSAASAWRCMAASMATLTTRPLGLDPVGAVAGVEVAADHVGVGGARAARARAAPPRWGGPSRPRPAPR